jgi:hypothetical protein
MTETGTNSGGTFSESVTGSDTPTLTEGGNTANQIFTRTVTIAGSYIRTDSGPGATLASGSGTIGASSTETADARSGILSQARGSDRYSLLEHFNDVSNTTSGNQPGNMNFSPFGQPFVDPGVGDFLKGLFWDTPVDLVPNMWHALVTGPWQHGQEHGFWAGVGRYLYNWSSFIPLVGRAVHFAGDMCDCGTRGESFGWALWSSFGRNFPFLSSGWMVYEACVGHNVGGAADGVVLNDRERGQRVGQAVLDCIGSIIGIRIARALHQVPVRLPGRGNVPVGPPRPPVAGAPVGRMAAMLEEARAAPTRAASIDIIRRALQARVGPAWDFFEAVGTDGTHVFYGRLGEAIIVLPNGTVAQGTVPGALRMALAADQLHAFTLQDIDVH